MGHGLLFGGFYSLSFLPLFAGSLFLIINISLGIPLQITTLLPASYRGHHRMTQVILAVG